jgi:hypothetical protein
VNVISHQPRRAGFPAGEINIIKTESPFLAFILRRSAKKQRTLQKMERLFIRYHVMELQNNYLPDPGIQKEADVFFDVLENILPHFMEENPDLLMSDNGYWGGGKNIELKNHTISIQHVRSAIDPAAASYLSISLYDLRFDENGKAFSKEGVQLRNFDFEAHSIRHQEVEVSSRKGRQLFWKDRNNTRRRYSTAELVHEWLEALVKCGYRLQIPDAHLSRGGYHRPIAS